MTLKSLNFTLLVVNVESEDLSLLSDELNKKRIMAPDFFSNAPVVVKLEDNSLNIDFSLLKKAVSEQGFILSGISGDLSESQKSALQAEKIAFLRSSKRATKKKVTVTQPQQQAVNREQTDTENHVEEKNALYTDLKTKIHTGRVRSGQQIYAKECDLVINGDVGAGAEVIADGDIHIYGALRGRALAGASGNQNAAVFCQLLAPELISIAGIYKLSDALPANFTGKSCIVALEEEHIVLTRLTRI